MLCFVSGLASDKNSNSNNNNNNNNNDKILVLALAYMYEPRNVVHNKMKRCSYQEVNGVI